MEEQKIPWVKGNTLNLSVPLQLVTVSDGQQTTTDYTPPEGSEIHVRITNRFGSKEYPYTISGNVVSFKDEGTLEVGCYGVEITVSEPKSLHVDGQNRRTFKKDIEIYNSLYELGTMPDGEIILDAAIFIQGQKGDPFTYEDFTPEEIEGLKKPAYDAAAEVTVLEQNIENAEAVRVDAEEQRERNEEAREEAEGQRQQSYTEAEAQRNADYLTAEGHRDDLFSAAEQSREAAVNEAVRLAGVATSSANDAAALANNKAQYAQDKGDYAKAKGDYADEKGTLANQKAGLAAEKAGLAEEKALAAGSAANTANTAAQNAKADYVGDDNYVYHWNSVSQQYEKTNKYVKGDTGTTDYNQLENKPDLSVYLEKITEEQFNEIFN